MAFIDGTVVNVALPAMQSSLHATVSDVQWVVESYALLLASLLLVGGSMGDLYGRRRIFVFGVILFTAGSTWCGLAGSIASLIVARGVQGVGAALLVPGSLALISASFPASERGRAIGTWSGFTAITAAVGPVLGGWLVDHASWRWVFFINLPVAAAVIFLALWRVPESRNEGAGKKLDWAGAALATVGLGAMTFAFIEAPTRRNRRASGCGDRYCRTGRLSVCRSSFACANGLAVTLSLAKLQRRQPDHALSVRGVWRNPLLLSRSI